MPTEAAKRAQTELAQTKLAQTERAQTTRAQTERTQTELTLGGGQVDATDRSRLKLL